MQFSRFAPIAAAAGLLLTLACDKTPEPLSPTNGLSFAAGGNADNQSASGHAVVAAGTQEYTFTAKVKKSEVTGQIDLLFHLPAGEFFMKADVTCLIVDPGTTHAAITAHVTSTNLPGSAATDIAWNVTDGGHGPNALPDAASSVQLALPGACATGEIAEETNDQIDIKVKP